VFAAGGCLCGAVRYECAAPPVMTGACHCRDCQRNSGSAFATLMIFMKEAVAVAGDALACFTHAGDSGKSVRRHFCRLCGSPVFIEYDVTPDFRIIMAGTLDDPELVRPQWNIYTASRQPWLELPPHMKAFARGFKRD
jgi:hypothetical protein